MIRILVTLLVLNVFVFAIGPVPKLATYSVKNGTVGLVLLENDNISEAKLSYDKITVDFYPHPNEQNLLYAFLPVDYHTQAKRQRVNVSYKYHGQKMYTGFYFDVLKRNYPTENLSVASSKVDLTLESQQRAAKEYTKALRLYKYHNPKLYWEDRFIYPLESKITSEFGTRRLFNGKFKSYHGGTDFRAKVGTPIKATNSGVVQLAQNRFYAGNSVIIDHGKGIFSSYYHLDKMLVKQGDVIQKGQIIGLAGATGRVTAPHLHFGIRVHGVQVDPIQFIKTINSLDNVPL